MGAHFFKLCFWNTLFSIRMPWFWQLATNAWTVKVGGGGSGPQDVSWKSRFSRPTFYNLDGPGVISILQNSIISILSQTTTVTLPALDLKSLLIINRSEKWGKNIPTTAYNGASTVSNFVSPSWKLENPCYHNRSARKTKAQKPVLAYAQPLKGL